MTFTDNFDLFFTSSRCSVDSKDGEISEDEVSQWFHLDNVVKSVRIRAHDPSQLSPETSFVSALAKLLQRISLHQPKTTSTT